MKRTFSFVVLRDAALLLAATGLVAATYGLVRLAYGLFLPDIQASVGIGDAVAGYVSSGASLAYCVGALCGLGAAGHSRRLVVAALATAALGSLGMALAAEPGLLAVSTVVASAGAGLASPALVAVVERNIASPGRDRAQAFVNSGTGPGLVAVGVLALVLLPDWRLALVLSAVVTVVAGVAVLLLDRRGTDAVPVAAEVASGWLRLLVVPATAALLLGAASAVVWTYGRSHLVVHGANEASSTLAWVAIGLGGTATAATAGPLSRRRPTSAWALTTGAVAAAVAGLGLGARSLPLALLACLLFGWGFVAATSALIAWAGRVVPGRAAPGTSLLFVTLVLGQALGSAVAGVVSGPLGMPPTFVLAALVAALAASCARLPGSEVPPIGAVEMGVVPVRA